MWQRSGLFVPYGRAPGRRFLLVCACCLLGLSSWAASVDGVALRRAIEDLSTAFPESYPDGGDYLEQLHILETSGNAGGLAALQREALLANPLLDFEELLLVRRSVWSPFLGLPHNWQGNCSLPRDGYDNDIAVLSLGALDEPLRTLFRPGSNVFVGDLDLNFDGERLLFSMPDEHRRWQIWETDIRGDGLRLLTPDDDRDIDNYDACYLPDGRIIYASTACYLGIPCVFGSDMVANLCIVEPGGTGPRQLCFDQDHNWSPVVLNSGRILYQRWEYTDLPHSNSRLLFHMNPDGTAQMEYYGSNSYWPNSIFYARPVPGHPTMVAGIVTGHHGVRRKGELVLFDPALGRREAEGVVQRIPGYGQPVEPIFRDRLVDDSWPKFLHPWPLSDKYFLVAAKPAPHMAWGIYLVDVFDNMLLLREEPGYALLQPIPLRPRPKPPVIPDRVDLSRDDAQVYLSDLYVGGVLEGVPPGTIKALRLFTYTYSYRGMGGLLGVIGMDGPWDIKRVLGTVPVSEDGSAYFTVPANTPIAVQPLDERGMAVQQMRSWFTAMPGETLSCVGCHEPQNTAPTLSPAVAMRSKPSTITPWYGRERGFNFAREVQPVLDHYCVDCHEEQRASFPDNNVRVEPPYLRGDIMIDDWDSQISGRGDPSYAGQFSEAYVQLHRFVRRPGIESDYHPLNAMEFHAGTTELVQMLDKGHHGVALDEESWDRLITWIDLNAPYHGTWTEILGERRVRRVAERTRELRRKYAGIETDYEYIPETPVRITGHPPPTALETPPPDDVTGRLESPEFTGERRRIALGRGHSLEFVRIPSGRFYMGSAGGPDDERPRHVVEIESPFWMGVHEITNAQYAVFDPHHDSGVESKYGYQFGIHGFPVNEPDQPVVRVSWQEAMAFCDWLGNETGLVFALPSEAQWEYACRAGAESHFHFGDAASDYSDYANIADETLEEFASNPYFVFAPFENPNRYDAWIPRDTRFSDGALLSAPVASYKPNAWGLHDMHGNVWEWTLSAYRPYPYCGDDGRNAPDARAKRVVRGGSWYDRPHRAGASFRLAYQPWQRVYNVGFRVIMHDDEQWLAASTPRHLE